MIHVTCRLTAKNRDQLRNHTLGNRVWATFTFYFFYNCLMFCGCLYSEYSCILHIGYKLRPLLSSPHFLGLFCWQNLSQRRFWDVSYTSFDVQKDVFCIFLVILAHSFRIACMAIIAFKLNCVRWVIIFYWKPVLNQSLSFSRLEMMSVIFIIIM